VDLRDDNEKPRFVRVLYQLFLAGRLLCLFVPPTMRGLVLTFEGLCVGITIVISISFWDHPPVSIVPMNLPFGRGYPLYRSAQPIEEKREIFEGLIGRRCGGRCGLIRQGFSTKILKIFGFSATGDFCINGK
jgi:hypothetical protein